MMIFCPYTSIFFYQLKKKTTGKHDEVHKKMEEIVLEKIK